MYAPLHLHTEYSLLDGMCRISELPGVLKGLGITSCAITDHGNMFGAVDFYKACKKAGIHPVIGCEVYTAARTMHDRDVSYDKKSGHLILLAETQEGYSNLVKIVSESYTDGFYYKPRVDKELLRKYSKGLICLSGCLAGAVQRHLADGDYGSAKEEALELADIFGRGNFFLELQNHHLADDVAVIEGLHRLSADIDVPLAATNDSHYLRQKDARAQDILMCVQTQAKVTDQNRMRFENDEFYIKSEDEMLELFPDDADAVHRTQEIADRCHVEFEFGNYHLPEYEPPKGKTCDQYLRELCYEGLEKKYGGDAMAEDSPLRQRLESELSTIESMGFVEYFLIVWDFINFAKTKGIPVGPGRGCCNAGTLIYTEQGLLPIEEIEPGMRVFSHDGSLQNVEAVFKYPVDEKLRQIRCYYGSKFGNAYTADHKILAVKAARETDKHLLAQGYQFRKTTEEPSWIPASELEMGDLVAFPKFTEKCEPLGVIDLAEYAGPNADIGSFTIKEHLSQNFAHPVSVREISRQTGVSRSAVKRYSRGESCTRRTKDEVDDYLASLGMSVDDWRQALNRVSETFVNDINRFVTVDEDFMFVLGAMTGNGWVRRGSGEIGFCCNSELINQDFLDAFTRVFGISFYKVNRSKTTKLIQYTIASRTLKNLFLSLWNGYNFSAQTKSLPSWVHAESESNKMALIHGLWSADGSHKEKSRYTTASWRLLNDVKRVLSSLNIPNSLSYRPAHDSPNSKVGHSNDSWSIAVPHNFGSLRPQFGEYHDDYVLKRIFAINDITDEKFVYDISVENNHSYVTDSFIAHNSAAGSIVSYCLSITELDPIKYALVFERFLNPERVSMPDIDVDFCIDRRQEVIDYVTRKYGSDKVSGIITFTTLKARAVVRDVARVLGASYQEGDRIAKAIPNVKDVTVDMALSLNPELKSMYDNEPLVKQVVDFSRQLEGLPRNASKHAAGVVISKLPLEDYVPLYASDKGLAVQFNMTTIEELGLLKMDFLGLRNLTVIEDALQMIKKNRGVTIDWDEIGLDDPAVYRLIASGNTTGVFQLEGGGMTDFLKQLKPTCFEDIIAGIALYRPGPMDSIPKYLENKKHPENIRYVDPQLAHILDVTYGCLIYQEQVMSVVRDLGGYSYGRSDLVRRAMSKKKADVMLKEKEYFIHGKKAEDGSVEIPGCVANGVSEEAAEAIFEDMVTFAAYAFNKSHAAAYAVVSYQTAYLKAHYPEEFFAALMTSMAGKAEFISSFVRNAKDMGIEIDPPSVLKSERKFTAKDGRIRFGLLGVKNIGEGPIEAILEAREKVRPDADFFEFLAAMATKGLNRKAVESLILAGAFDDIEPNRAALMAVCDDAVKRAQKHAKSRESSQVSLFDLNEFEEERVESPPLPNVRNFSKKQRLEGEKEMLGIYMSGHPLDEYSRLMQGFTDAVTTDVNPNVASDADDEGDISLNSSARFRDGDIVVLVGMISDKKTLFTKKDSKEMAKITLEDYVGTVDCVIFSKLYEKRRGTVMTGAVVAVKGRVSKKESAAELLLEDIVDIGSKELLELAAPAKAPARESSSSDRPDPRLLKLRITSDVADGCGGIQSAVAKVRELTGQHPGTASVRLYLPDGTCLKSGDGRGVNPSGYLRYRLGLMLGKENVKLEEKPKSR